MKKKVTALVVSIASLGACAFAVGATTNSAVWARVLTGSMFIAALMYVIDSVIDMLKE